MTKYKVFVNVPKNHPSFDNYQDRAVIIYKNTPKEAKIEYIQYETWLTPQETKLLKAVKL